MARPTIASLRAELEALRHNCNLVETERDSLRSNYAVLEAQRDALLVKVAEIDVLRAQLACREQLAAPAAPAKPKAAPGPKRVFEFDPKVPDDFVRAAKLALEFGGAVRRMVAA